MSGVTATREKKSYVLLCYDRPVDLVLIQGLEGT